MDVVDGGDPMYEIDWDYAFTEPGPSEHVETWKEFSERVKHGQRFFDPSSVSRLSQILGSSASTISPDLTVTTVGAGNQVFFRGRLARTSEQAASFIGNPRRELSPLPRHIAAAGRMNPAGIPFFYGAYDEATCITELRPPVAALVVTGGFEIVNDLHLLDLTALSRHRPPSELSYFADDFLERLANRRFLREFEEIISRPIKPDESAIESVPTQMVAEYVRNTLELDGIIYKSAQSSSNTSNVIIFTEVPEQSTEDREPLQLRADSVKAWEVQGVSYEFDERFDLDFSDLSKTINALGEITSRWNRNQVALIATLTDHSLHHDDRVRRLFGLFRQQAELVVMLQFRADQAKDEELQVLFAPVIENYRQRLQHLEAMLNAAIGYDDDALEAALAGYQSISSADTVRPLLENLFGHPRLELIFTGTGVNPLDLISALVGI